MERYEILEQLRKKLDENLNEVQSQWYAMPKGEIIGHAEEINATRIAYNDLYGCPAHSEELLEYLLRFENPLEVVRDKWIEERCDPDVSLEMNHVLNSIKIHSNAEWEYELDKGYKQSFIEPGMQFGG